MKYVKTFENFEYLLEAETATEQDETKILQSLINSAKEVSRSQKTSGASKEIQQNASSLSAKPGDKKEDKDTNLNEELNLKFWKKDNPDEDFQKFTKKFANDQIKRLPKLVNSTTKDIQIKCPNYSYSYVVPAGMTLVPREIEVKQDYLSIVYIDGETGDELQKMQLIGCSNDEINHVKNLYKTYGEEVAKKQKESGILNKIGGSMVAVGFLTCIGNMVAIGPQWQASGTHDIPALFITGAAVLLGGGLLLGKSAINSAWEKNADKCISTVCCLLKIYTMFSDIKITDIKSGEEINDILNDESTNLKKLHPNGIAVEELVATTTSGKVESVGNRLKGFKRF